MKETNRLTPNRSDQTCLDLTPPKNSPCSAQEVWDITKKIDLFIRPLWGYGVPEITGMPARTSGGNLLYSVALMNSVHPEMVVLNIRHSLKIVTSRTFLVSLLTSITWQVLKVTLSSRPPSKSIFPGPTNSQFSNCFSSCSVRKGLKKSLSLIR